MSINDASINAAYRSPDRLQLAVSNPNASSHRNLNSAEENLSRYSGDSTEKPDDVFMSNNVRSALDRSRRWLIILVFHFLVVIIRLSVLPPPMRKPRGATPLYNARGGFAH